MVLLTAAFLAEAKRWWPKNSNDSDRITYRSKPLWTIRETEASIKNKTHESPKNKTVADLPAGLS